MSKSAASIPALILCSIIALFPPLIKCQDSIADAARKNRAKESKESNATPKRVWTNDDVASASGVEGTTPKKETTESITETLRQFRILGKDELGAAVLKQAGVPDVNFPERRDWEQRLFSAKQAWLNQVERMEAHKDSSQASQEEEIRLAVGTQRIFERIKTQGIELARAEVNPVLKAQLAYKRQQDYCNHISGELRDRCELGLDQMKQKMQQEGIWPF